MLRSAHDDGGAVLAAALAGLAVGLLAGRLWCDRRDPVARGELGDPDESWADRWGERVDAAVEAGSRGLRDLRRRWGSAPPVNLERALAALEGLEGAAGIGVHDLGEGIVELVGEAPADAALAAVASVEAVPGVRVVVNRVWSRSPVPVN